MNVGFTPLRTKGQTGNRPLLGRPASVRASLRNHKLHSRIHVTRHDCIPEQIKCEELEDFTADKEKELKVREIDHIPYTLNPES